MARELRGGEVGECCDGGGGGAGTDTQTIQFGDTGGLPQNSYMRAAGNVLATVANGAPIPVGATIVRWLWRASPPSNVLNVLNFDLELNGITVVTTALPGGGATFSFDLALSVVVASPGAGSPWLAVRSGAYSVPTDRPTNSQTDIWYRMP